MMDEIHIDPFERHHVGTHAAFTVRVNPAHVDLARKAIALRMDVPVGSIEVDWDRVRASQPITLRRAA